MDEYESLNHTKWECKYHVVFIPKCRRKTLYLELRKHLGEVFRKLATQKESKIEEGHLLRDHVHMMIAIPPKYAVSQVIGYIKGKSAIHLARVYGEKKRNFVGQHFWARGYFVSTVGRDEEVIREYIRAQEKEDSRLEGLKLPRGHTLPSISWWQTTAGRHTLSRPSAAGGGGQRPAFTGFAVQPNFASRSKEGNSLAQCSWAISNRWFLVHFAPLLTPLGGPSNSGPR